MSAERRLALFAYVLVLPVLALILGLVAYPFLFAIWVSFTDRVIGGGGSFIGLDNFRYLANSATFGAAIRNTVLIVLVTDALKLADRARAGAARHPAHPRAAASSGRS